MSAFVCVSGGALAELGLPKATKSQDSRPRSPRAPASAHPRVRAATLKAVSEAGESRAAARGSPISRLLGLVHLHKSLRGQDLATRPHGDSGPRRAAQAANLVLEAKT